MRKRFKKMGGTRKRLGKYKEREKGLEKCNKQEKSWEIGTVVANPI